MLNNKQLRLLKQLHTIYGAKIDSVINGKEYQRSCHLNQVNNLKKRFHK